MSFHGGQTFVYGEVPSATKWQYVWDNDNALADGTAIAGLYKNLLTVDSNPYKFSAYRNAAHTSSTSFTLVQHDTELFDTNSNFDTVTNKGRYTAPVSGFYLFTALAGNSAATGVSINSALYKNGSLNIQGSYTVPGTAPTLSMVTGILQLTAGDYVEHYFIGGAGSTMYATFGLCYFHGFLISRT